MSNVSLKKREAMDRFFNREFSAIPQCFVLSYMKEHGFDALEDITELTVGTNVSTEDGKAGEIVKIQGLDDEKSIDVRVYEDDKEKIVTYPADEVYRSHGWQGEKGLPMWGTMWVLNRNDWMDRVQDLSDSGFAVFDVYDEDLMVVGIDGAGYDFYEDHWEPLYDRLGLDWHKQVDREVSNLAQKAISMAADLGLKPEDIAKKLDLPKDFVADRMPKQATK